MAFLYGRLSSPRSGVAHMPKTPAPSPKRWAIAKSGAITVTTHEAKMPKQIDPAKVERIKRLHASGMSLREVAAVEGVSSTTVLNYARPQVPREEEDECSHCGHSLREQHTIHGCRAATSVNMVTHWATDMCRCKHPYPDTRWTTPHCLHCKYLRNYRGRVRSLITYTGERINITAEGVSKSKVTCVKEYWDGAAYLQCLSNSLRQPESYFKRYAIECEDFTDMRPSHDEAICETKGCSSQECLSYIDGGMLKCKYHRGRMYTGSKKGVRENQEQQDCQDKLLETEK